MHAKTGGGRRISSHVSGKEGIFFEWQGRKGRGSHRCRLCVGIKGLSGHSQSRESFAHSKGYGNVGMKGLQEYLIVFVIMYLMNIG